MLLFSILLCAGVVVVFFPLCCFMVCFRGGGLLASLPHRRFGVWISPQVVNLVLHPLPQWPLCPGCVVTPSPI